MMASNVMDLLKARFKYLPNLGFELRSQCKILTVKVGNHREQRKGLSSWVGYLDKE